MSAAASTWQLQGVLTPRILTTSLAIQQRCFNTGEGDVLNARPAVYPEFPPLGEVKRIGKNLAVSYRHTFSPNLVNEFTAGFNRFAFVFTFGESNKDFPNPAKVPLWADD